MTSYLGEKAVGINSVQVVPVNANVVHDESLVGNGYTEPLGVNTEKIVSKSAFDRSISTINDAIDENSQAIQNNKIVTDSAIDGINDAIEKTREDYIQADSEIHQMLNGLSAETTTIKNNQASLGTQVANIEHKIPDGTTGTNSLINKQILAQTSYTKAEVDAKVSSVYKFKGSVSTYNSLPSTATTGDVYNVTDTGANYAWDGSKWDKLSETIDLTAYATTAYVTEREQDIRSDLGENISEVHTQVVGLSGEVAAVVSGKQDKLTAGENITIEDGVISATCGGDYLPLSGGTLTGALTIDGGSLGVEYGNKVLLTLKTTRLSGQVDTTTISAGTTGLHFSNTPFFGVGSITPAGTAYSLGGVAQKWWRVYATILNNGADIAVPTTGGTMLVNQATGNNSLTIGGTAATSARAINIGIESSASDIGATAIGYLSKAKGITSLALGANAQTNAVGAIQINASGLSQTNSEANTLKVANTNGNFEMMDANGNVPLDRLTYVTDQIGDISTALTAILGE